MYVDFVFLSCSSRLSWPQIITQITPQSHYSFVSMGYVGKELVMHGAKVTSSLHWNA